MSTCRFCQREYVYNPKKGHGLTICNSCVVNRRRYKIKMEAVIYKGGKCEKCGYNKSLNAFHFHHLNPLEKKFSISGQHSRSFNSIKLELDKCILLCANCHAEIHTVSIPLDYLDPISTSKKDEIIHGTQNGYRKGCRCIECKETHATRIAKYRLTRKLSKLQSKGIFD